MAIMHRITDWLGMERNTAVAGLHVGPSHLSLAVVRPGPARLTALGRRPMQEAAVVDDEVRLALTLAGDLSALVSELRLPTGIGVVAAIEPRDPVFRVADGETMSPCPVRQSAHDRLVGAIHGAGLKLLRLDPVPAALARLARLAEPSMAAASGAYRWSLLTADGYTDAERSDQADDPRLRLGPDLSSLHPLERTIVPAPRRLRSIVDLDRDAVAIGAALAAANLLPLVEVQPVPEGRGGDWTMQQVAGPRSGHTGHTGHTGHGHTGRSHMASVAPQPGPPAHPVPPTEPASPNDPLPPTNLSVHPPNPGPASTR